MTNKEEAKTTLKKAIDDLNKLDCKSSLDNAQKVLKYSFENDDYSYSAKAYNIIGLNYEEFSDLKKALYYYTEGIKYALKANDVQQIEYLYNNTGNLYFFRLDNPKIGLDYYLKCYKYSKMHGDLLDIAFTELNIADVYFKLEQYEEGKKYLDRIIPTLKDKNEFEMYVTYYTLLGNYYSSKNQNIEAEKNYNLVIERLKENNVEFYKPNEVEIYDEIYKFYKKNNNIAKALFYLEKHDKLQDELELKTRSQDIKFAGTSIDVLEMNNKIQKIATEKKVQDQKMNASSKLVKMSLFFAGILLIFLIFIFKNYLEYRELNKKLNVSHEQLKIAKQKSEEASILKSQFLTNVSHELRTPLYGVIGMADIIESEHKELKNNEYFKALKFSSNYLLSLINDVLNVYKIEDEKFELKFENVELRKEVKTIKQSLKVIARSNNNDIILNFDESVPQFIKTDLTRFSQILINLISNSLKFTKNGHVKIVFNLIEENEVTFIKISVIDNGIGIPEEYLDKIFDKFVQLDVQLQDQYKGTGLGLSIVKKLVELFNGTITVESKINEGTQFNIQLPYVKSELESDISEHEEKAKPHIANLNILVVEDNKINQMVTKKLLEKCHHKCTIVENGQEAIDIIKVKPFDLILMDIHMPVLNGIETSKQIRELGITTPIIALTASDRNEVLDEVQSNGISDILVKPFEFKDLQLIIDRHL
ncbi:tetratricopeptide repeat-containing hybrid sensor histidine kinase/response regulator [Flavobacterium urocaniciphilum]|uniref:tetratricopeptide repeat-containing hybrid sensor histidine kinase/response regulator n=1 Tax=Flavobacterium urocaniciphilum TaxID=1299341 RepID=UPI0015A72F00|nr:ATP-binding protein [Flavobacterium urocaniciphilum]